MQEKKDVPATRMDTGPTCTVQVTSISNQEKSDSAAKQMNDKRTMASSSYTSFPPEHDQRLDRVSDIQSYDRYNESTPLTAERSHLFSQYPHIEGDITASTSNLGSQGYSEDYLVSSSRSLDSSHRIQANEFRQRQGPSRPGVNSKSKRILLIDDTEEPIVTERDPIMQGRFDRNLSLNQEMESTVNYESIHKDNEVINEDEEDELEGSATDINRRMNRVASGFGESFPSDNLDPRPEFTNSYNPQTRDRFRRKLRYFFMNPLDKWRTKGKLPWKLGLQVVKIIVVTLQLLIFGSHMSKYLSHQGNMVVTFRELFMSNWDPVREVMTYPPSAGPYAVYTKDDFYKHVNNAIVVYAGLTTSAIGLFGYAHNVSMDNPMSPITMCKEHYTHGVAIPSKFFYNYTNIRSYECLDIVNTTLKPGDPVSNLS